MLYFSLTHFFFFFIRHSALQAVGVAEIAAQVSLQTRNKILGRRNTVLLFGSKLTRLSSTISASTTGRKDPRWCPV